MWKKQGLAFAPFLCYNEPGDLCILVSISGFWRARPANCSVLLEQPLPSSELPPGCSALGEHGPHESGCEICCRDSWDHIHKGMNSNYLHFPKTSRSQLKLKILFSYWILTFYLFLVYFFCFSGKYIFKGSVSQFFISLQNTFFVINVSNIIPE